MEWDLLKRLARYARKKTREKIDLELGGTTNGTLLTKDKFSFLQEHGIFFLVSLDGTQKTHDYYRKTIGGKGTHSIIMKNMEKALKWWPFYRVRMSPYPSGVHRFYADVKYLLSHGIHNFMFSPVFEAKWEERHWKSWEEQCYRVIDLIAGYKKKGIFIDVEHFRTYSFRDNSCWPCGAANHYVGFDVDGGIYPCHRFIKFDGKGWQEKEICIGHVAKGILKPRLREEFIYFQPIRCKRCDHWYSTPCHGGCYAVNYDLNGSIEKPATCRYIDMQAKVSKYYMKKVGFGDTGTIAPVEKVDDIYKPGLKAITPQKVMDVIKQIGLRLKRLEEIGRKAA